MAIRCSTPGIRQRSMLNRGYPARKRPSAKMMRGPPKDRSPARRLLRQRDRDADDEEEEREDQVGRRPPVPVRVQQGPVDVAPVPGIVDDDHAGHGEPAEDVERHQAVSGWSWSRTLYRYTFSETCTSRRTSSAPHLSADLPAACAAPARAAGAAADARADGRLRASRSGTTRSRSARPDARSWSPRTAP